MARATHYETLGLRPSATEKEVKAAYRRVVLRHHPDRSSDPASPRVFLAATEAYGVLNDPEARRRYDEGLESESRRRAERAAEERRLRDADSRVRAARAASTAPTAPTAGATAGAAVGTQLSRLSMLFSRGLYAEAEKLADEIVRIDPRQPLPYAVRGDLARGRGRLDEAARQYSLAIQMDPRNPTYLKRYEEVLLRATPPAGAQAGGESAQRLVLGALFLVVLMLFAGTLVATTPGEPAVLGLSVAVLSALFVCGLAVGACLSVAGGLDRLDAYSGRVGPTVALGLVSVVSFPVAMVLYVALGLLQRGFSASTTRLFAAVAVFVTGLAIATTIGDSGSDPLSVLLWGGNLACLGALCGWAVADGLRAG